MASKNYKVSIQRREVQVQFYEELLDDDTSLEMVIIPEGSFLMGAPKEELEYKDMDGPQHEVQLSSFSLSSYPVTQAQWSVVADWPKISKALDPNPSRFQGKDRPVECVSWSDVVEFCARLSYHAERRYRLPTEAEWEYACRAGTTTPFHFGQTITTELANYRGTHRKRKGKLLSGKYGRGPLGVFRNETTPVQLFKFSNAYGLCDMHGNVFEWCEDVWHGNYQGAPRDGTAWLSKGISNSSARVARGGSYTSRPGSCRSAYRIQFGPSTREPTIGFRLACAAPKRI